MVSVAIGGILAALAVICFVIAGYITKRIKSNSYTNKKLTSGRIAAVIFGLIFVIALVVVPSSIHTVEAGSIAVVKQFGRAIDTRSSGMYFDLWFVREYVVYDITVQQEDVRTAAYSKDAQQMDIEMVVQYQIQPEHAVDIINNYGSLENLSSRIQAVSIEKAKTVLSSKSAMNIIETRDTVSPTIEDTIKNAISGDYYVNITTVVVTNIDFSDAFENTVEEKMIAEQQKLKAEYEKDKAIIEAQKELEVAKLEAEAIVATAEGNADAKLAISQAEAEAIRLKSVEIARMLGFKINASESGETTVYTIDFEGKTEKEIAVISDYLKYIEYLSAWDGKLPTTYVTDSGASMILPAPTTETSSAQQASN